jgi:solute carrier family 25 folate transporter 32
MTTLESTTTSTGTTTSVTTTTSTTMCTSASTAATTTTPSSSTSSSSSNIQRRFTTVDVGDMTMTTVEEYNDEDENDDDDDDSNNNTIIDHVGVDRPLQQQQIYYETQPQQQQQRDWSHYISTFVAGVGSGILASIVCAPLDLMRTRMQVWGDIQQKSSTAGSTSTTSISTTPPPPPKRQTISPRIAFQELLQREGWRGMFRGLGVTLVTVPLFWGVYFPLYDETKHYLTKHHNQSGQYPDGIIHMSSAVFTGAVADVICNPLFVIRTRLQTQALHQILEQSSTTTPSSKTTTTTSSSSLGIVQTAKALYERHGITIFWRGMSANLIGLSHVAVQFPAYESLKKYFRDQRREKQEHQYGQHSPQQYQETVPELLLASGLAKSGASLLSYPHEVLRSRMMDNRNTIPPTLIGTAKHILQQEGVLGLYNGLSVTLLRVIPNCCVTFLSYELILRQCKSMTS